MIYNDEIARQVAEYLLQIKAIILQPDKPFTWSSGWKSPIYCDNRISLSHPQIRTYIKEQLAAVVKAQYADADLVAGVATAGIAQGALVADYLDLPFAYVRPEPKKHGLGKQIEGRVEAGQKAVVVEDLISTGRSSLKALKPLQEAGVEVLGVEAIFHYGFQQAVDNFIKADTRWVVLSSFEKLLPIAYEKGYIKDSDIKILQEWRVNPENWEPA